MCMRCDLCVLGCSYSIAQRSRTLREQARDLCVRRCIRMLIRVCTIYPSDCLSVWGYTFGGNDEYLADLAIGNYKNAIHGLHLQYVDCLAKLNITVLPTCARTVTAAVNVGIGKIMLAPATPTVGAAKKHVPPSSVDLGAIEEVPSFRVYASPKVQLRENGDLGQSENQCTVAACPELLAPFWLVKTTLIVGDANMELVQVEHGGFFIPCLKNTKAIKKGEVLQVHRGKAWPAYVDPVELVRARVKRAKKA